MSQNLTPTDFRDGFRAAFRAWEKTKREVPIFSASGAKLADFVPAEFYRGSLEALVRIAGDEARKRRVRLFYGASWGFGFLVTQRGGDFVIAPPVSSGIDWVDLARSQGPLIPAAQAQSASAGTAITESTLSAFAQFLDGDRARVTRNERELEALRARIEALETRRRAGRPRRQSRSEGDEAPPQTAGEGEGRQERSDT